MSDITAINVSDCFTNKAIEQKDPLTVMQALKLTYIAQGFHLSLTEKLFYSENIEAWKHGPVVQTLYNHLCQIKSENHIIQEKQDIDVQFDEEQTDILTVVFGKYAKLGAWDLSELTHKRGTPWEITYSNGPNGIIKPELIAEHFRSIVTTRSFAILLENIKYS